MTKTFRIFAILSIISLFTFGCSLSSTTENKKENTTKNNSITSSKSNSKTMLNETSEKTISLKDAHSEDNPIVIIETSLGDIEVELFENFAPISVANFLSYVEDQYYNETIFHRVMSGFMVQGGGFDTNFSQKPTKEPIKNEAKNGLKNDKGTLAMARTSVVDSATSQFFINANDNDFLNNGDRDFGYAVFGNVTKGMDVVTKIEKSPTRQKALDGMPSMDVPVDMIEIKKIYVKQ